MSRLEDLDRLYELGLVDRAQWTIERYRIFRDLGVLGSLGRTELEIICPQLASDLCRTLVNAHYSKGWTLYPDYRLVLDGVITVRLNDRASVQPFFVGPADLLSLQCNRFMAQVDLLFRPQT